MQQTAVSILTEALCNILHPTKTLEYEAHIPGHFSQMIYHWDWLLSKLENKNLINILYVPSSQRVILT